jgi:hypothetical protein
MPQDNRAIDSPIQPCPCVTHSFHVDLGPAPDESPRPAWWPLDRASAYGGEDMSITLGGVGARQTLSGGAFRASGIPPGVAQVHFEKFFDEVRADVERRTAAADA